MKIKILIPIYNDWQSVFKLLENINSEVLGLEHEFSAIIVNDASTESRPETFLNLDKLNSDLFSVEASLTIITDASCSRPVISESIFSKSLKTDCQSL